MNLLTRYRDLVINLLFALHLALFAPRLLTLAEAVVRHGQTARLLGLLILAGLAVETVAFHVKIMAIYHRSPDRRSTLAHPVLLYLAWFNHLFIGVYLAMMALQAVGVKIDGGSAIGPVIIVGWILKEFYIFGFLMICRGKHPIAPALEWLADLLLLVFACMVYTFFVQTITGPSPLAADGLIQAIGVRMAYAIIFAFFYAAAQTPQLIQMSFVADARTFRRWMWSLAGIILLAALAG